MIYVSYNWVHKCENKNHIWIGSNQNGMNAQFYKLKLQNLIFWNFIICKPWRHCHENLWTKPMNILVLKLELKKFELKMNCVDENKNVIKLNQILHFKLDLYDFFILKFFKHNTLWLQFLFQFYSLPNL